MLFFGRLAVLLMTLWSGLIVVSLWVSSQLPLAGDLLAFSAWDAERESYGINIVDWRRGARAVLENRPYQTFYGWSADGRFVYLSDQTGNTEVYLWDGLTYTNISQHPMNDWRPAISGDGRVAFASERDGNMEIYVWEEDTLSNISQHNRSDDYPAWSADGRLVFLSDRDGSPDLYVWDGSNIVRVTESGAYEAHATWGPDGRLAYLSSVTTIAETGSELRVVDRDGTIIVVASVSNAYPPMWSADGRLVYGDGRTVTAWTVAGDGVTATDVTAGFSQTALYPSWRGDGLLTFVAPGSDGRQFFAWDGQRIFPFPLDVADIDRPVWSP